MRTVFCKQTYFCTALYKRLIHRSGPPSPTGEGFKLVLFMSINSRLSCYVSTNSRLPNKSDKRTPHLYGKELTFWSDVFIFRYIPLRRQGFFFFCLLRRRLMRLRFFPPWFCMSWDTRWWRFYFGKSRFPYGSCRRGSAFCFRPLLPTRRSFGLRRQVLRWICFTLFSVRFCLTVSAERSERFPFCLRRWIWFRSPRWTEEGFWALCFLPFSVRRLRLGYRIFSACFCLRFYGCYRFMSFFTAAWILRCFCFARIFFPISFWKNSERYLPRNKECDKINIPILLYVKKKVIKLWKNARLSPCIFCLYHSSFNISIAEFISDEEYPYLERAA